VLGYQRGGDPVARLITLFTIFFLSVIILGATEKAWEQYEREFIHFRDTYDAEGMEKLIEKLEALPDKDYKTYTLLADALVEYALWGLPETANKKEYYEKARNYAEEAIKLNPDYAYAYFVRGAAIGRLAQYVGILKSLFMVGDFDKSILKAIELDPRCYRAMVAMGMRYRDLPWPFKSYSKAEKFLLKAIKIEPRYINSYLELGILYQMWGKSKKAIETFQKVLELPPMKGFTAMGLEAKEEAKRRLKELGAM